MQQQKVHMDKRRFRIGDLAEELKVKKFVIRFWEKEFDIKSDRSEGGQRFYTSEDLQTFIRIKDLLYNKGFTIAGAKKQLYVDDPVLMSDALVVTTAPVAEAEGVVHVPDVVSEVQQTPAPMLVTPAFQEYLSRDFMRQVADLKEQLTQLKERLRTS
jgi:DNA-binding transcriptional MerR regulator